MIPNAEEILERNLASMGGAEVLRRIESIESSGHLETQGVKGDIYIARRLPNRTYQRVQLGPRLDESGYDGTIAWNRDALGFRRLTGDEVGLRREGSTLLRFLGFRDPEVFTSYRFTGQDSVDGVPTYVVEFESPAGFRFSSFFAHDSCYELKRVSEFIHSGRRLLREVHHRAFRKVGDHVMAFEVRQVTPFNELKIVFHEHRVNSLTSAKEWWEDVSNIGS